MIIPVKFRLMFSMRYVPFSTTMSPTMVRFWRSLLVMALTLLSSSPAVNETAWESARQQCVSKTTANNDTMQFGDI
jgi:hypothetical protein